MTTDAAFTCLTNNAAHTVRSLNGWASGGKERSRLFPVWQSRVRALLQGEQGIPKVKISTCGRESRGTSSTLKLNILASGWFCSNIAAYPGSTSIANAGL